MKGIAERLKVWYRGRYISPPPNHPYSSVVFVSPGHYEQPALAKVLGIVGRFWLAHWKWIIGTVIAVVGLYMAGTR
jgi:hypothetical protein